MDHQHNYSHWMFSGKANKSKITYPQRAPFLFIKISIATTSLPDINIMKLTISLALNRKTLQCPHLYTGAKWCVLEQISQCTRVHFTHKYAEPCFSFLYYRANIKDKALQQQIPVCVRYIVGYKPKLSMRMKYLHEKLDNTPKTATSAASNKERWNNRCLQTVTPQHWVEN